jgi:hypothetical protein
MTHYLTLTGAKGPLLQTKINKGNGITLMARGGSKTLETVAIEKN